MWNDARQSIWSLLRFSLLKRIDAFHGHVTPVTSENHEKLGIGDSQNIIVKILLLTVQ